MPHKQMIRFVWARIVKGEAFSPYDDQVKEFPSALTNLHASSENLFAFILLPNLNHFTCQFLPTSQLFQLPTWGG